MKKLVYYLYFLLAIILFSGASLNKKPVTREIVTLSKDKLNFDNYVERLYKDANLSENGLSKAAFREAVTGYWNIVSSNPGSVKTSVLSVLDFTMKSTDKRLWVIDLGKSKLLYRTLAAHGKNSGELYATHFSNELSSNMSSLGFFITAETYIGKHGLSLSLDGIEKGFNDNARERSLVVHAADYVSDGFIQDIGRLGRSQGCPAVPAALAPDIINTIADGSCLFIYYPDRSYENDSKLLNSDLAQASYSKMQCKNLQ